jgi:hypothetical protein
VRYYQTWGPTPRTPPAHVLHLTLTGIKQVNVDLSAARNATGAITIDTDGAASLGLERLRPGTEVLEHGRVITKAGSDGAAGVSLPEGSTGIELVLPRR